MHHLPATNRGLDLIRSDGVSSSMPSPISNRGQGSLCAWAVARGCADGVHGRRGGIQRAFVSIWYVEERRVVWGSFC